MESCSWVAEAEKYLFETLKRQALNPAIFWYQAALKKLEKENLWSEADLEDQDAKVECAWNDLILTLYDENSVLFAELNSLAKAEEDIVAAEALGIAFQSEADRYDILESELKLVREEVEKIRDQMDAGRIALEKKESMEAAGSAISGCCLGFERCKDQIRVFHPELPLQSLDLGHEVFEGRIVKPQAGAPLEEAEVVFLPSLPEDEEEDDKTEFDSLGKSRSASSD